MINANVARANRRVAGVGENRTGDLTKAVPGESPTEPERAEAGETTLPVSERSAERGERPSVPDTELSAPNATCTTRFLLA